jgi:hypothetical protein
LRTGTSSGRLEDKDGATVYRWILRVEEARQRVLDEAGARGLREVDVRVSWAEGEGEHEVRLTTLAPGRERGP